MYLDFLRDPLPAIISDTLAATGYTWEEIQEMASEILVDHGIMHQNGKGHPKNVYRLCMEMSNGHHVYRHYGMKQ